MFEPVVADAQQVTSMAAVIGRAYDYEILHTAVSLDEMALINALDALWRRRFIRKQAGDLTAACRYYRQTAQVALAQHALTHAETMLDAARRNQVAGEKTLIRCKSCGRVGDGRGQHNGPICSYWNGTLLRMYRRHQKLWVY